MSSNLMNNIYTDFEVPEHEHIKDFDSWEFRDCLFKLGTMLNDCMAFMTQKTTAPRDIYNYITKQEFQQLDALQDWIYKNQNQIPRNLKQEPLYIDSMQTLRHVLDSYRLHQAKRQKVIDYVQYFLDYPSMQTREYFVATVFNNQDRLSNSRYPWSLINFNEEDFSYSNMQLNLPEGVKSEDLTLCGHIFYSKEIMQVLFSTHEDIGLCDVQHRLFKSEAREPLNLYEFNDRQYSPAELILLKMSIGKTLQYKVVEHLATFSRQAIIDTLFDFIYKKRNADAATRQGAQEMREVFAKISLEKPMTRQENLDIIDALIDVQKRYCDPRIDSLALVVLSKVIEQTQKMSIEARDYLYRTITDKQNGCSADFIGLTSHHLGRLHSTLENTFFNRQCGDQLVEDITHFLVCTSNDIQINRPILEQKKNLERDLQCPGLQSGQSQSIRKI